MKIRLQAKGYYSNNEIDQKNKKVTYCNHQSFLEFAQLDVRRNMLQQNGAWFFHYMNKSSEKKFSV